MFCSFRTDMMCFRRCLLQAPSSRLLSSRALSPLLSHRYAHSLLKLSMSSKPIFITVPSRRLSSRLDPMLLAPDPESELFNYTSARFIVDDAYNLRERRRVFNVQGLFKIIAAAMSCQPSQIVDFRKLDEGGCNRISLVTLDTGLKLVARIPYPLVPAKAHVLASEVATMDFLRAKGLPVPEVYAYAFAPDNAAGTEYILMEYVDGIDLGAVWSDFNKDEIASFTEQLAKLESTMMSVSFPAGGSIYYAKDLEMLCGNQGVLLDECSDRRGAFCVGPEVAPRLWYGRREQLDVFRGPYRDDLSALTVVAEKELVYLDRFGAPRAPLNRTHREIYNFEKQSPLDHAQNLHRYLALAPLLLPSDPSLRVFCVRHPDLTVNNIKVARGADGVHILSLLDWQFTSVLPVFLAANMPEFIENGEEVSMKTIGPKLPDDFDTLSQYRQNEELELLRSRLADWHYVLDTAVHNHIHHQALVDPLLSLRQRVYMCAGAPWEGETYMLACALLKIVRRWQEFPAAVGVPCPVSLTPDEIAAIERIEKEAAENDGPTMMIKAMIGCGTDYSVPVDQYEAALAREKEVRQIVLEGMKEDEEISEEHYAGTVANWPFADRSEEELEEYK